MLVFILQQLYDKLEFVNNILSTLCIQHRKVQMESATGSSNSYRVRTTLTISVENIDFDTQACVLRLKGRNVEENKYVKVEYFNDNNFNDKNVFVCKYFILHMLE